MNLDSTQRLTTDILIVGGGAVGLSLAIGLAKLKKRVTLIDMKSPQTDADKQACLSKRDARVYALNLASLKLFDDLGISRLDFLRRADYTQMQVWQGDGRGQLDFATPSLVPKLLGSMIEPMVIDDALDRRAKRSDVTPFLCRLYGVKLSEYFGMDRHSDGVRVQVVDKDDKVTIIDACLMIGADGRGSVVRQMAGIGVDRLDYHQTAICCAIQTTRPHANTARQAMLATGTLALLPLADLTADDGGHWHSVVWTLPTDVAKTYLDLPPDELADKLALASGFELGEIVAIESIASFALSAQVAKSYTASHTLLIGDAAHGVHPLAGQGLNLGLADVAELLRLFERLSDGNKMPPTDYLLRRYERARKGQNTLMMHSFSLINYAFVGDIAQKEPMRFVRAELMNLTGKVRPLMDFFNHKASGL